MATRIHSTAVVDPTAELGEEVVVGPHAVIGPEVVLGRGTEVGAGAQLRGPSRFGVENRIFPHACLGLEPQDLKYGGERVALEVGDRNIFREFTTVHRGTAGGGGVTRIGSDNLFMVYSHIAHDCTVGSRIVFANCGTLAGHVEVQDDAVVGAFSSIHQFCRVGRHAYVGGYSVITMDALPYVKTVGIKPLCYGLNRIGLKRKGFGAAKLARLEKAVRLLTRSGLNTTQALEVLRTDFAGVTEVEVLVEFIASSQRGFIKATPGRRGARGGGG